MHMQKHQIAQITLLSFLYFYRIFFSLSFSYRQYEDTRSSVSKHGRYTTEILWRYYEVVSRRRIHRIGYTATITRPLAQKVDNCPPSTFSVCVKRIHIEARRASYYHEYMTIYAVHGRILLSSCRPFMYHLCPLYRMRSSFHLAF